ncbi:MAG: homoserine O-succinyltransferase [Pseudomonadota bacterium]|nr:homoserine O-succinyltransferase [Pseudomonadota bacterium]
MPLVAHTNLPTFDRLKNEGFEVLSCKRAGDQYIRELHVGLLNMMPDAALAATERQFYRLIARSNLIAQFHIHPFTLDALPRGEKAAQHIADYYEDFSTIQELGLDALIITGANVTHPHLADESFWEPLAEVISWAYDNVTSTLCSCLATHAVVEHFYGINRYHLGFKRWGVFEHRVTMHEHPLVQTINSRFDVPHSRFNQIDTQQLEGAGLRVLVESETAGVHLAVSPDLFRQVFFQGHPEYDINSLLKEYKREVGLYLNGLRHSYPPFPDNYFSIRVQAILDEFRERAELCQKNNQPLPEFPEALIMPMLDITWRDTAKAVISNWLGMVYQITNKKRNKPFMDGVVPADPLGLR